MTGADLFAAYWEALLAAPDADPAWTAGRTAPRTHWMTFRVGCRGAFLEATLQPVKERATVGFNAFGGAPAASWPPPVETDLPLVWRPPDAKGAWQAFLVREGPCRHPDTWPELHAWTWESLRAVRGAFAPLWEDTA